MSKYRAETCYSLRLLEDHSNSVRIAPYQYTRLNPSETASTKISVCQKSLGLNADPPHMIIPASPPVKREDTYDDASVTLGTQLAEYLSMEVSTEIDYYAALNKMDQQIHDGKLLDLQLQQTYSKIKNGCQIRGLQLSMTGYKGEIMEVWEGTSLKAWGKLEDWQFTTFRSFPIIQFSFLRLYKGVWAFHELYGCRISSILEGSVYVKRSEIAHGVTGHF